MYRFRGYDFTLILDASLYFKTYFRECLYYNFSLNESYRKILFFYIKVLISKNTES